MKIFRFVACLAVLLSSAGAAWGDCERDRMNTCAASEKSKPASSRGGLSVSEFCAAEAVATCAPGARSSQSYPGPALAPAPAREAPRARAAAPQAPATDKRVTEIVVGTGKLRIHPGDGYGSKSWIRYDDNLVQEFDGEHLTIVAVLFVGQDAVLIYSTNPGGSGTVDSYGIVSVGDRGKVYVADLPVGTGRFEYLVTRDRISFELGIERGMETKAVFANGRLDVSRTKAPPTGLGAQQCDMLYNDYLDECADARQTSCTADGIQISMARQRPVNMLAYDDPNFRRTEFDAICLKACKAKRKPSLAEFRKAICLPK